MSVKKSLSLDHGGAGKRTVVAAKRGGRFDRCFSFLDVAGEQGKSLEQRDSEKLKAGIKRWAKAVAAYARQVSGRFGSSRG